MLRAVRLVTILFLAISFFLAPPSFALVISYEVNLMDSPINQNGWLYLDLPSLSDVGYSGPLPSVDESVIWDIRFANNEFIRFTNRELTQIETEFRGWYEVEEGVSEPGVIDPSAELVTLYGSDGNNLFTPEDLNSSSGEISLGWLADAGDTETTCSGFDCPVDGFTFDNDVPYGDYTDLQYHFVPGIDVTDFMIYGLRFELNPFVSAMEAGSREDLLWRPDYGRIALYEVAANVPPDPVPAPVPEPGTIILLATGLGGLAGARSKKFRK